MFSAFSFGKIIKTILPGAILTTALFLVVEGLWAFPDARRGFLLALIPKDWITPVTAALIPLSLILGFFLNTFTWRALNRKMRGLCDAELKTTVYCAMRKKLSEELWADTEGYFRKTGRPLEQMRLPDDPPLEYYYLPKVTLTNLNYLWESYFCWYEFDVNSACALLVCLPAAGFLLWARLPAWHGLLVWVVLPLLVVAACAIYWALRRLAIKNLVRYQENLMLLIVGSLVWSAKGDQSSPVACP